MTRELNHIGNGYMLGKILDGYKADNRRWIGIENSYEEELQKFIKKAICFNVKTLEK